MVSQIMDLVLLLKANNCISNLYAAGIGPTGKGVILSEDGYEKLFATNHLGHFKMYKDLASLIERTAATYGVATISHVSSAAHYSPSHHFGGVFHSVEELNDNQSYVGFERYGTTKLFNILFANEISDRLQAHGVHNVLSNSLHPGSVATNFGSEVLDTMQLHVPEFVYNAFHAAFKLTQGGMWSAEDGARTQ